MIPSRFYPAEPPQEGHVPLCTTEKIGTDINDDFEALAAYSTRIPLKNRGAIEMKWKVKK